MAEEASTSELIQIAIADADRQAQERVSQKESKKPTDEVVFERRRGTGDIDEIFYVDANKSKCKLITLRITFNPNGESAPYSTATVRVYEYTETEQEYNCQLFRVTERGPHSSGDDDVFVRNDDSSAKDPSSWTVPQGSGYRVTWTAPNSAYKWAIEIGLARSK